MRLGVVAHTVAVGQFEGPLGLLLELVESGQIEITSISIGDITSRYLARIAQMDVSTPEELADFVELGGRLLYIKSLSLLPPESGDEQPQEMSRLNEELAEYRRMQLAAGQLATRIANKSWPRPTIERLDPADLPFPEMTPAQITQAFLKVMARQSPKPPPGVITRHLSQATITARLKQELTRGSFTLQSVMDRCSTRVEIIVTFLALLELWREGIAVVVQSGQFDVILVEPARA